MVTITGCSFKVTVQALGWGYNGRYLPMQDDVASVAYWYQTLPAPQLKPLPGRDNIVVTRDAGFSAGGTECAASVDDALDIARRKATDRGVDEIMVIGGAEIFALTLPLADRIYLTRIHARPDGDVTFPEPDPGIWREVSRSPLAPDARDDAKATLLILERAAL